MMTKLLYLSKSAAPTHLEHWPNYLCPCVIVFNKKGKTKKDSDQFPLCALIDWWS
jgi:hypothetical protein